MTHPNQWPDKKFIPGEGDLPVETVSLETHFRPDREGISGVSPEERAASEAAEAFIPVVPERVKEIWKNIGAGSCAAGLLGENKPTGRHIPL